MNVMPVMLDLFCGAGGATRGYQEAGFYVIGVDKEPQPNYCGDRFYQMDWREGLERFGKAALLIHASPPCQSYSAMAPFATPGKYPKLIGEVREALQATGKYYVIENVQGARRDMKNYVMLCGTMFGLMVIRHRLFECNPIIAFAPKSCYHHTKTSAQGRAPVPGQFMCLTGNFADLEAGKRAMGIDWMKKKREVAESIPPAYTRYIGKIMFERIAR